jgi:1,4-dihydroxy-6-naphthoate synthase
VVLEDVQTLNEWAIASKIDISKISYVLPLVLNNYTVLDSGGALGKVGPLLITKNKEQNENINDQIVAIPGRNTTAHLLFSFAFRMRSKNILCVSIISKNGY